MLGSELMTEPTELREPQGMTLRDYARVLARRWWLILLVTVVAAGSAFAFSVAQTKMYQADAKLLYESSISVASPLTGATSDNPTNRQAELAAAVTILGSPDMQERGTGLVEDQLGGPPPAAYEVEGEVESSGSDTSYTDSVVIVMGRSEDPAVAAAAANAYAEAFVGWRKEKERTAVNDAIAALKDRMKQYKGAAKQSTEYVILAQRLEDMEIRKATITGNFRLVVPAVVPESPYEPKPLRSAILGLAVGLFAGIGLAFLLEQFDTRIHGAAEVARILRRPVLGRIPRFGKGRGGTADADESRVVALSDPDGAAAEAFRVLRSNLEFMSIDADVRSIGITSSEQGEGKSVTACNLAVSLALAGKRVILVDGDLRRPRIHRYLGLENDRGVTTVVTGKDDPLDALQRVDVSAASAKAREQADEEPGDAFDADADAEDEVGDAIVGAAAAGEAELAEIGDDEPGGLGGFLDGSLASDNGQGARLSVLTRGPRAPNPGEITASQRFADVIAAYVEVAEIVLIDTPAFLAVGDAGAMARAVDSLLFVVDPDQVRRPTLEAAAERLAHLPAPLLGVVVLRRRAGAAYRSSYEYGYYSHDYHDTGQRSGNGRGSAARRRKAKQQA